VRFFLSPEVAVFLPASFFSAGALEAGALEAGFFSAPDPFGGILMWLESDDFEVEKEFWLMGMEVMESGGRDAAGVGG
jgi:hypothetical protein